MIYFFDLDEENHAFEFKWSAKKSPRFPAAFLENYPGCQTAVINRDNFDAFVGL
jgi:hypothetical protein